MSSTPPAPLRVRADGGPLWLSRSLIVSGAVWMLLLGAALGASFGLWGAWNEIQSQRYADLEFKRTCFLLLEHAADHGVQSGAITALWFLILGLLVSAYAPVRVLFAGTELDHRHVEVPGQNPVELRNATRPGIQVVPGYTVVHQASAKRRKTPTQPEGSATEVVILPHLAEGPDPGGRPRSDPAP